MHTQTRQSALGEYGDAAVPLTGRFDTGAGAALRAQFLSGGQNWNVIEPRLPCAGRITLVPANEAFAHHLGGERFLSYGKSGAASEAIKTSLADFPARAPNLWYSSYRSEDGQVSFGYLRSGTISRYGEPDPAIREAANFAAAKEIIEAARVVAERRGARARLSLLNIDLQTPASAQEEFAVERETVKEQAMAFASAAKENVLLQGEKAHVQFKTLVFPSHELGCGQKEEWRLSQATVESVREILERPLELAPPPLRGALQIMRDGAWRLLSKERQDRTTLPERFALAAHVVILASLTGDVVHFNCRSGKDRTGFLDVEAKFLGYQLSRRLNGKNVSLPGAQVLPDEARAWKEILLYGGNREVQQLNTGYAGSKLSRGLLLERVGPMLWNQFVGESRQAGS